MQEDSLRPTRCASIGVAGPETVEVLSHAREGAQTCMGVGTVCPRLPTHLLAYSWGTCKFSRDPEAPDPLFRRNPRPCAPRWLPPRRASKGGSKVDPSLGLCLFRSYQHCQEMLYPRCKKIPSGRPAARVSEPRVQKLQKCYRMRVKGLKHAWGVGTVCPRLPTHLRAYSWGPCKFSRDPKAPEPLFRRNPRPCGPCWLPPRRASQGGSKVDPSLGLCYFRSYQYFQAMLYPRCKKIPSGRPAARVSEPRV
jgi:hypothetical protein